MKRIIQTDEQKNKNHAYFTNWAKNLRAVSFILNQSVLKTKFQYIKPKFCDKKFITEMFTLIISKLENYFQKYKQH